MAALETFLSIQPAPREYLYLPPLFPAFDVQLRVPGLLLPCELQIPKQAEELVLVEIEELKAHGKAFRRLTRPLAEADIQQGTFDAAGALLRELLDSFKVMVNHDVPDQLGLVRSVIGLARVHWSQERWSEARQTLEQALSLAEHYKLFPRETFI